MKAAKIVLSWVKRAWEKIVIVIYQKPDDSIGPAVKRKRRTRKENHVVEGGFRTLRTLLDGLDDTFDKLERASRHGLPSMVRKHGPFIFSADCNRENMDEWGLEYEGLAGFEAYGLPAILFCNMPWDKMPWRKDNPEKEFEGLHWAIKTDKVPSVRRMPGFAYYEYGIYFPRCDNSKIPEFAASSNVAVHTRTGRVVAVPTYSTTFHKVNRNGGGGPIHIPSHGWRYQSVYNQDSNLSKQVAICRDFSFLYSMTMRREMGTNIVVTRGDAKATFIVPENEWKRFFAERVDIVKSGRKRPIFHAVAAHERKCPDGHTTNIRTHYRGSRVFEWNGYQVSIVMPGKHGVSQASFGVSAVDPKDYPSGAVRDIEDVDLSGVFGHHKAAGVR